MTENVYEAAPSVAQYLLFHYGEAEDQLDFPGGPTDALFYPIRCVSEFAQNFSEIDRALDLGCAVGRSSFELARSAREVIGIDFSHSFIIHAQAIAQSGSVRIKRIIEGSRSRDVIRSLPAEIDRSRCRFITGDALALPSGLGRFDLVLAANLIDRVRSPRQLLKVLAEITAPGGSLILASPYTWLPEFTPVEEWLGNQSESSFHEIKRILTPHFELHRTVNLPFLISETARKYQWSVAEASLWRRRQ